MTDSCTEYIARISYGKDSLKMLDVIKSRGLPLDRITTTDVWATDTIPANLPEMMEFKAKMDQIIWSMYHIEVEHLCALNKDGSKKTYEQMFYHIPVRRSQIGNVERERAGSRPGPSPDSQFLDTHGVKRNSRNERTGSREVLPDSLPTLGTTGARSSSYPTWGKIKGWPLSNKTVRWCQHLKSRAKTQWIPGADISMVSETQNRQGQDPLSAERPTRRRDRNIVEYLGIAADEPARFGQLNPRKRAPLVEFGIEEDLCGLYCQYADMLAPTYETSCRDGCWFCHNQGVDQLRLLRRNYPDLWALLMKWDLDSPVSFKADGHTVHDFDRRFRMEDERKIPTDRTFRWSMLDNPPKFVAYTGDQLSLSGFRR